MNTQPTPFAQWVAQHISIWDAEEAAYQAWINAKPSEQAARYAELMAIQAEAQKHSEEGK